MSRILIVTILFFISIILSSCDKGLEITDIEISKYPDNIVYVIGRESQLNLQGLTMTVTTKDNQKS